MMMMLYYLNRKVAAKKWIVTRRLIRAQVNKFLTRSLIMLNKRLNYMSYIAVKGNARAYFVTFAYAYTLNQLSHVRFYFKDPTFRKIFINS